MLKLSTLSVQCVQEYTAIDENVIEKPGIPSCFKLKMPRINIDNLCSF